MTSLALLPSTACTATTEINPDDPTLSSLSFEGNDTFGRGELEGGLATDSSNFWPFTKRPRFDAAVFQGDVDRIVTFYKARGYFDAKVTDVKVTPNGKKGVDVRVFIFEGEPYKTRSVNVDGTDGLPAEAKTDLAKPYDLVVGKTFTEAEYQHTKDAVLARIHEYAYAAVTLEGEADVDRNARAVDVKIHVTPGEHYRYGTFDVIGNHKVSDQRILRQIQDVMKPGDEFQSSDLENARVRLQALGVFGNVNVIAGDPDPKTGTIPIVVSVAEAPFQSLRAGGGIGIDVEHQEAHVSAGYTDRDFLGHLRRLDFDNTFALEWLPNIFDPEFGAAQPAFTSTLKLTQPDFFAPKYDLETSLQGQREVEIGYADWALRGRVAAPIHILKNLTFTPAYNAELTFFDNDTPFNGLSLTPAALLQLGNPYQTTFVLSYLEEAITLDLRDNPIEPRLGFFAKLTVQEAGGPLFGDFSDIRILPEVRGYLPLGKRDVIAMRFQLGLLYTYDGSTSPIDQRFFLGGLDSVRGYGSLRLSPMARVNTCGPLINGKSLCNNYSNSIGIVDVPIGGNGMVETSVELRHKLSDAISLVAFADVGQVDVDALGTPGGAGDNFTFAGFSLTPGLGLRVQTPIGPIRVDLAYLLVAPPRLVTPVASTFGQQSSGYYPTPNTSAGAVDNCGIPFVPQTGWGGTSTTGQSIPYAQPSACKSAVLRNLSLSIAIGEAY